MLPLIIQGQLFQLKSCHSNAPNVQALGWCKPASGQSPAQIAGGRGRFMKNHQLLMIAAIAPGHFGTGLLSFYLLFLFCMVYQNVVNDYKLPRRKIGYFQNQFYLKCLTL